MEDYEIDYETACPKCGNYKIHYRTCAECEDGYIYLYDEDPLWYDSNEYKVCTSCKGTGVQMWCPECGKNLSGINLE